MSGMTGEPGTRLQIYPGMSGISCMPRSKYPGMANTLGTGHLKYTGTSGMRPAKIPGYISYGRVGYFRIPGYARYVEELGIPGTWYVRYATFFHTRYVGCVRYVGCGPTQTIGIGYDGYGSFPIYPNDVILVSSIIVRASLHGRLPQNTLNKAMSAYTQGCFTMRQPHHIDGQYL